jgi:hypothetical protein
MPHKRRLFGSNYYEITGGATAGRKYKGYTFKMVFNRRYKHDEHLKRMRIITSQFHRIGGAYYRTTSHFSFKRLLCEEFGNREVCRCVVLVMLC